MIYYFPYFVFTILLCTIMSIALTLFFGYHLYLVKIGMTTNETIKLGYLKYDYEDALKRKEQSLRQLIDEIATTGGDDNMTDE
jgi:hypothetical protein